MDDLISRQTDCVLKEFGNCSYSETGCADCEVKASIRNALSAQWKRKMMYTDVSDTISRRDAIDALRNTKFRNDLFLDIGYKNAINIIESLPTAQPERKKGKWIQYDGEFNYDFKCSECGYGVWDNSDFCPGCGADMRGEQNG